MDALDRALEGVRRSRAILASSTDDERNEALMLIRKGLLDNEGYIFAENGKDLEEAEGKVTPAVMKRLLFGPEKLGAVTEGIDAVSRQEDPIGHVLERRELDDGLILSRVSVPIGVIGMIFESRPDALVQIVSLALKSGNALILKGGKEAKNSNRALTSVIRKALEGTRIGSDWLVLIESHEDVSRILKMDRDIDLLIPRGSNAFVRYVMDNTSIPVLGHADGICSVYVDRDADMEKALKVALDSKIQYPAACNAAETILVHGSVAPSFLPRFARLLKENGVKVHADPASIRYFEDAEPAVPSDWDTEYLAPECAVRCVDSLDDALMHIREHSSGHTDSIVTENDGTWLRYRTAVDSADVFRNCSTRFADGFRFGLGAEVGISTSKIHARGPVGIKGLMSSKWMLEGSGQTVAEYSGPDARKFKHRELPL